MSQVVVYNNSISQSLRVTRGVPQGSNLGPLLYTLYINDLHVVLKTCKVHIYADDVQLYHCSNRNSIEKCGKEINEDLATINDWAAIKSY